MIHRSPHDQFVKAILQKPGQAKAYFRQQLPERLLATIDLDGLQQVSESFLDDKLQESFSDLLYKVPLKNNPKTLYLSLLLEHKSYADPYQLEFSLLYLSKGDFFNCISTLYCIFD